MSGFRVLGFRVLGFRVLGFWGSRVSGFRAKGYRAYTRVLGVKPKYLQFCSNCLIKCILNRRRCL